MKIILLRHGETAWNKESRIQGHTDIPLASEGCEQLRLTGSHLAQTRIRVDQILSSPLKRAHKSAEIVAEALGYPSENIITEPLFIERGFGDCEGMVYGNALSRYPDDNIPGMETLDELFVRAKAAIDHCASSYPDKTILVASHGALIKAVLVVLTNGRVGYFDENIWIENGSYCLLESDAGSWNISVHSPGHHFKPQMLS